MRWFMMCLILVEICQGFDKKMLFEGSLKNVEISSAKGCRISPKFMYLIHSAPGNTRKRNALRATWAANKDWLGSKRVFFIGRSYNGSVDEAVQKESDEHEDVFFYNLADTYRNMTLKHVIAYRWLSERCAGAEYILKTDDDTFVDVFHLNLYLPKFKMDLEKDFFLCNLVKGSKVVREEDVSAKGSEISKWVVSRDDYRDVFYPPYCTGAAYVTKTETVNKVLAKAREMERIIHVDDAFMTGIAAPKSTLHFDWSWAFLQTHLQAYNDMVHGTLFTPELMVAYDLDPEAIMKLHSKTVRCKEINCYKGITKEAELDLKPKPHIVEEL